MVKVFLIRMYSGSNQMIGSSIPSFNGHFFVSPSPPTDYTNPELSLNRTLSFSTKHSFIHGSLELMIHTPSLREGFNVGKTPSMQAI